jgi:hypothetical protein
VAVKIFDLVADLLATRDRGLKENA